MRRRSRDLDFRFQTAKSIAYNIKSAKFSFSPRTLKMIQELAYYGAIRNRNFFKTLAVKVALRNMFHHDFVYDVHRSFDTVQRSAIVTSDLKKMTKEAEDETERLLGKLEVLGEDLVGEADTEAS